MRESSEEQRLQELINMAKMAANKLTSLRKPEQPVHTGPANILEKEMHLSSFPKHLIHFFQQDQD
jgi:hypothetical protein